MSAVDIVAAFGAAWVDHDLDACLGMLTDDAVFESTGPAPDGVRHQGGDAILGAWKPIFDDVNSRFTVEQTIAADDRVVQLWRYEWADGHVRGIDVFRLSPSEFLSENELAAANLVRFEEFNSQNQPKVTWPPSFVVAKAYLDQLERGKTIDQARATALRAALDRGDTRAGRNAANLDELDKMAAQLDSDAAAPGAREASRMKAMAAAIKARTARLR